MEKEYIQSAAPDKMKLAELLIKAKGSDRTMVKFSETCGVNTSTLSRISTGKINKPVSVEVLEKIYKARSNDATYSFDTILLANGMIEKGTVNKEKEIVEKMLSRKDRALATERHAKNAIVSALLERGVSIQTVSASMTHVKYEAPFSLSYCPDFAFYFPNAPQQQWYFEVQSSNGNHLGWGATFRMATKYFLLDAWAPEFLANKKTSFVFCNRREYQQFVMHFKDAPIKTAMSAILIDEDQERFIEESWISSMPETKSVLSLPVIETRGDIATWKDEEELFDDFDE